MKIKKLFSLLITTLSLTLAGCGFNPIAPSYENNLVIKHLPNKVLYSTNELFTLEGLKVVNLQGEEVLDYVSSISEGTLLRKAGERKVDLTKEGYRPTSFKIKIEEMPKLVVANEPNKKEYVIGEYFNVDGLLIKDDSGNEISDYTLSKRVGDSFTTVGEQEITVSKEKYVSTSFKVNVLDQVRLVIEQLPKKLNYTVGEAFSSEGLVIGDNRGKSGLNYTLSIKDGEILKYSGNISVEVRVDGYSQPVSFDIVVTSNKEDVPGEDKNINIYYVNDTHGSFARNESEYEAGMAYLSSFFQEKKAEEDENAIILSGGDMFQGGVESNCTYGKIMVEAMNIAGFDAMAVGNHEFDWGEQRLKEATELMEFEFLSCNTFYSSDRTTRPSWLKPFTIIERKDVKIGIVGFARSNMGSSITTSIANNFYFPTPNGYVKDFASTLRSSYNCDIVLAVGHAEGFEGSVGDPTAYADLTQIDPKTGFKYVDGMFFAHDHLRKYGAYNDVPYLESGCNGRYVGHMKFELTYDEGEYSINKTSVDVISSTGLCKVEDKDVTELVTKYADLIIDPDEKICTLKRGYTKEEFCVIICEAMVWFVNNNPEYFDNKTVYFASHNEQGVRANVYAGDFTYRQLVEVCPFDNALCIQKCNSTNISRLSSYGTYTVPGGIKYTNGYTNAVTISYIAEYRDYYQQSYIAYENYTAKTALYSFLKNSTITSII